MNRYLSGAVVALCIMAFSYSAALAQTAGAGSASSAGASAGAYSGGNTNNFAGTHFPQNTPDAFAPSLTAGANQCALSTSVGVGVAGFGIGFGSSYGDHDCRLRAWYSLAMSTYTVTRDQGLTYAAKQILCSDKEMANLKLSYCGYRPASQTVASGGQPIRTSGGWYFCPTSREYYGMVNTCSVPWQQVQN